MDSRIIQVTPTDQCFSITWELGRRCNYDCMYCGPQWHDDHSKHKSLDELKANWIGIYEQSQYLGLLYKISFTGGEVTGNRDFYPFVKWLRENYGNRIKKLLLTTNGSATYKYYVKMFEVMDNISFSVHSEHIDEQKFFDTVIKLHSTIARDKFIHVNIMNEFWNQDRILMYERLLKQHKISYNVNKIEYSYQTRTIPIMKGNLNLENTTA